MKVYIPLDLSKLSRAVKRYSFALSSPPILAYPVPTMNFAYIWPNSDSSLTGSSESTSCCHAWIASSPFVEPSARSPMAKRISVRCDLATQRVAERDPYVLPRSIARSFTSRASTNRFCRRKNSTSLTSKYIERVSNLSLLWKLDA